LLIPSAGTVALAAIVAAGLRDRAVRKQAGKIVGMDGVAQEERVRHASEGLAASADAGSHAAAARSMYE